MLPSVLSAQIHVRGDVLLSISKDTFIYTDSISYSKNASTQQKLSRYDKIYASADTDAAAIARKSIKSDGTASNLVTLPKIATDATNAIEKVSEKKRKPIQRKAAKILTKVFHNSKSPHLYLREHTMNYAVGAGGIVILKNLNGCAVLNKNDIRISNSITRLNIIGETAPQNSLKLINYSFKTRPPPIV